MKRRFLWIPWSLGFVSCLICQGFAAPLQSDTKSIAEKDDPGSTFVNGELSAVFTIGGFALLVTFVILCVCGDKPKKSEGPAETEGSEIVVPLNGSAVGDHGRSETNALSIPSSTDGQNSSTPVAGSPSKSIDDGSVSVPGNRSPILSLTGNNSKRSTTMDRELPDLPLSTIAAPATTDDQDFDGTYDTIRDTSKDDAEGNYAAVSDTRDKMNTKKKPDSSKMVLVDEPEGDYADVNEMEQKGRAPLAVVDMDDADGDYAAVDLEEQVKKTNEIVVQPPATPKRPQSQMKKGVREGSVKIQLDISDAGYARVHAAAKIEGAPKGEEVVPKGAEGGSGADGSASGSNAGKVKGKKNHGYAKIDDVKKSPSKSTGSSGSADHADGAATRPLTSPHHSPNRLPSANPQNSLPSETEDSAASVTVSRPTDINPNTAAITATTSEVQQPIAGPNQKKEPSYTQVSARESLKSIRARQQEEHDAANAVGRVVTQLPGAAYYQTINDESENKADSDYDGLYESVDYQDMDADRRNMALPMRPTSRTMPPQVRRGRHYEEISDMNREEQSHENDVEPYAIVEAGMARRKTAPSRVSVRSNDSDDFDGLYAKVNRDHKDESSNKTKPSKSKDDDFALLYAKVKKPPKEHEKLGVAAGGAPVASQEKNFDQMYAKVNRLKKGGKAAASSNSNGNAEILSQDSSYQSIDEVNQEHTDSVARKAGMVHIDDVKLAPLTWTKREHTYASVDQTDESEIAPSNVNETPSSLNWSRPRHVEHSYEEVDIKERTDNSEKKSDSEKNLSNDSTKSPTHLNSSQLEKLADDNIQETDL